MELKAYVLAIKAGWKIILGTLVVAVAAAVVLSLQATPSYVSTTRLFVASLTGGDDLDEFYQRSAAANLRIASYAEVASSGAAAEAVSEELGYPVDPGSVTAAVVTGTVVLQVSVTDADAERAQEIATAYAEVLPGIVAELDKAASPFGQQVGLQVIDEAGLPGAAPTALLRNLLAAVVLGLGLGIGIAVLRYALRQDRDDRAAASSPPAGAA